MSNKSFFVLLGAVLSPFAIIWTMENVGTKSALLLFIVCTFMFISYFKRAKDV